MISSTFHQKDSHLRSLIHVDHSLALASSFHAFLCTRNDLPCDLCFRIPSLGESSFLAHMLYNHLTDIGMAASITNSHDVPSPLSSSNKGLVKHQGQETLSFLLVVSSGRYASVTAEKHQPTISSYLAGRPRLRKPHALSRQTQTSFSPLA